MENDPKDNPAKVCEQRCATCIFDRENRFISTERFKDLRRQWKENGGHQICHKFGTGTLEDGLDGEDVWCRGFYDAMVDETLQDHFEADGWVKFVPLPEEG